MTVVQLLFVQRDGADVILDGVLVADAASGPFANAPTTLRLRLPQDPEWSDRLFELLQHWAHTSRVVHVGLRSGRVKTVAEVAYQRSTVRLDLVEAVG